MRTRILAGFASLSMLVMATPGYADDPVKVYILMGQSNMVGAGKITGGTDGYLDYAVYNKGKYQYLDNGGSWAERNDVRNVRVMSSALGPMGVHNNEWMSVSGSNLIGPEFGIGHYLGEAINEPVMILKSCIGNRSLGWDLLPPGSDQYVVGNYTYAGYGDSPDRWLTGTTPEPIGWQAGIQYDGDVRNAKTVLDNIGTYCPGATEYEVAGFFWWQGDKDRYNAVHAARYEQNLVQLINRLRVEFDAPNASFVSATLGQTQIGDTGNEGLILDAQLAVDGDAGNYPEFAGNVKTVYSNPLSMGGASNGHYNGNAETYMNVGEAMGQAMVSLLTTPPYVTIDQQTGEIKIVNPADGDAVMNLDGYSMTSASGALDALNWTSIAGNYDLAGDNSVDSDGNWGVQISANSELSEVAQVGGADGLIATGSEVSLGVGAWIQNPIRDIKFLYTNTPEGPKYLTVRYVGDDNMLADINFDGTINHLDWSIFISAHQADLSALSLAQAYQMGDLDGDLDSDMDDYIMFKNAYELLNSAPGAFDEMRAGAVPEPSTILLLASGIAGMGMRRKRKMH
jgi:hypothetical protein